MTYTDKEIQRLLDVVGDREEDINILLEICKKRGKEIDKLNNIINNHELQDVINIRNENIEELEAEVKELEDKLKLAEVLSDINMTLKIENYKLKDEIKELNKQVKGNK